MSSKITDLPFEVLLQVFKLYIDSIYDPEVLLQDLRRPYLPVRVRRFNDPCVKPKPSATAKRGIIRSTCKTFRSVIDSSSYWAGRTLVATCSTMDKRRWALIESWRISSLELKGVTTTSHKNLCNLSSLTNLKHFSFDCHPGNKDFKMLLWLSNCKLQSLELPDIGNWSGVGGPFECDNLLPQLAIFKKSLKKITTCHVQSPLRRKTHHHFEHDDGKIKLTAEEAAEKKQKMIRKMKNILPLLQNVVLVTYGNLPSNPALVGNEISDELQDPFEMLEHLTVVGSHGVLKTQEEFVVDNEGKFHLKKVIAPYHRYAQIEDEVIDHLLEGRLKNLRSLEIGHQRSWQPSGIDLKLILSEVGNLNELKLHAQEVLENKDVDEISANNHATLKVLWFDNCKQIDDHCLFDLKDRFPSLTHLTVTECHGVNGTFLSQNYESISTMPQLQFCKCHLYEKNSTLVISIFKRLRQMTNNKIELWLI